MTDIQRAIDDAAKGKIHPVYVLVGSQQLLVGRAVEAIRGVVVGGGPRGLSEDAFEASQTRGARVVDTCHSLPMMSKYRFVSVRAIETWKADDLNALLAYLDAPTPSTVLVLTGEKLDGKTKFAAAAKKKNVVFEAEAPSERELPAWIEGEARRRGAKLSTGVASSLALAVGADLDALADAIERVHLFAGDRAVTTDDVDEVVAPLREASKFELPEAVGERDLARALTLLDNLLAQREAGLMLLAFIASRVRQIARARDAIDKREDPSQVLSGSMPPFLIGKVVAQAKRWTTPQVTRALRSLANADLRLKSGGGRDREARVMEELLLALTGHAPGVLDGHAR